MEKIPALTFQIQQLQLADGDDHKTTPGLYDTTRSNIACLGERERDGL
jgi:hypothetical protein